MHAARRSMVAGVAGLAALGILPAASVAQAQDVPAPDTVRVRMSMTGAHAPDALAAGRYRLSIDAPRRFPGMLQLVKPNQGYTRADFRADSRQLGRRGSGAALRRLSSQLRYFGGAVVAPTRTGAMWETLYAGHYWLMAPAARPGGMGITTVQVHGTPAPTRFPSVSANATGTNTGLRLERRVPRTGRMLIRNTSNSIDLQLMLPLKAGASYNDFYRWARHPMRAPMPLRFRGARITSALSPDAGYVLRYQLHPGRYVVFGLSSLNADRLRQVFQPLTVRAGANAAARRSSWTGPEGFEKAPRLASRVKRWGATRSGDPATNDGRLSGLRSMLTRLAAPRIP
jgi:hypothetical protein